MPGHIADFTNIVEQIPTMEQTVLAATNALSIKAEALKDLKTLKAQYEATSSSSEQDAICQAIAAKQSIINAS